MPAPILPRPKDIPKQKEKLFSFLPPFFGDFNGNMPIESVRCQGRNERRADRSTLRLVGGPRISFILHDLFGNGASAAAANDFMRVLRRRSHLLAAEFHVGVQTLGSRAQTIWWRPAAVASRIGGGN